MGENQGLPPSTRSTTGGEPLEVSVDRLSEELDEAARLLARRLIHLVYLLDLKANNDIIQSGHHRRHRQKYITANYHQIQKGTDPPK